MPGHILTTNLTPSSALRIAARTARELGFSVHEEDDGELSACKGNFALSIFLGAFIAYCNFRIAVIDTGREGITDIEITRNSPWWTGVIGVNRVKKRAKELADEIADVVEEQGGRVLKEKDF